MQQAGALAVRWLSAMQPEAKAAALGRLPNHTLTGLSQRPARVKGSQQDHRTGQADQPG